MIVVRQSTTRIVTVGPVMDASGVAVTDCVVGDFKIAKNGGAPAALNGSATLTHRHTGFYSLSLTTSDVDTVGQAEVTIDDTVNSCGVKELTVVEEVVYDALFAASALGYVVDQPVNVTKLLGTAWLTPGTAGTPDVNVKLWNALATVALPLVPTTAGRTLDVSTAGEAGVDWANVGSPTTTLALTGTTIATTQKVDVETIKTNPVVNAGTVTFPTGATLASTTNLTAGTVASVSGAVGSVTGNVGGNVVGSVGSVTARVTANTDQIDGSAAAAAAHSRAALALCLGTVTTGGTTTSIPTSALTPSGAALDQFKGRIIIFDRATTTAALRNQATDITASTNAATPTFTVTALSHAPASGDTFVIV